MKSGEWLDEIMRQLGRDDERKALRALRAGLHLIRDRLPDAEAVQLAAQIPTLLRGIYYDGWRPGSERSRPHGRQEILDEMREHLDRDATLDPELVLRAVIRVLAWHVTAGELDDVSHTLPRPLAEIWAEACG
jgi:uncharacterized protein (DUF2267 family)